MVDSARGARSASAARGVHCADEARAVVHVVGNSYVFFTFLLPRDVALASSIKLKIGLCQLGIAFAALSTTR